MNTSVDSQPTQYSVMPSGYVGKTWKPGEQEAAMLKLVVVRHDGQLDKGGNPYAFHLIWVRNHLHTDDERRRCVALAHDFIEDNKYTKGTYQELMDIGFDFEVIQGIWAMTKVPGETLEQYRAKVKADHHARWVKQVDLRHNMDLRRLKGCTEKDLQRSMYYHQFYWELDQHNKAGVASGLFR